MRKKKLAWDDKLRGRIERFNLMLDRLRGEGTKRDVDKDVTLDSKQKSGKMVEVWARIGITLELTEEEYEDLLESQHGGGELMRRLVKEGRIWPAGESYTPEQTEVNGKEIGVELTYDDNWIMRGRE